METLINNFNTAAFFREKENKKVAVSRKLWPDAKSCVVLFHEFQTDANWHAESGTS